MSDLIEHKKNQTIELNKGNADLKREEISLYFNYTWDLYESLFDTLVNDEAYYQRSQPLRHPLLFYLGHTATFFVNKLVLGKILDQRIDPKFESLFAIGVDEMSWDDLNDDHYNCQKLVLVQ